MEEKNIDLAIIGGGPGGYVAAIKAGQLGLNVLLIERDKLGGVCLNVGCIPSKALVEVSRFYERLKHLYKIGIKIKVEEVDWKMILDWKDSIVSKLVMGVGQLCEANNVEIMKGEAKIVGLHELIVKDSDKQMRINFNRLVIAAGSYPVELPEVKFDHNKIIDSTDFLSINEIPSDLVVVGGGYIGLELGSIAVRFGCRVSVVEMLPQILPGFDSDVVKIIERGLKKAGMNFFVNSVIKKVEYKDRLEVIVDNKGDEKIIAADKILVSVGRKPLVNGFDLERIGVKLNAKGFIDVDDKLFTGVEGIYAIGDVVGMPMLAHKASKEGEIVAEILAGKNVAVDYKCVPSVVYTEPEIAIVGMTENQALENKIEYITGKFPFAASGRAQTMQETDGFVKVMADKKTHEILGVTIIGPNASDLISEAILAIEMGAVVEDIALTVHPHPTLSEALMEAAKAAIGEPIHIIKSKDN